MRTNRATAASIVCDGEAVGYDIVRTRRRTTAIIVRRDGSVSVRAPWTVSDAFIEHLVAERVSWISRKRHEALERVANAPAPPDVVELERVSVLFADRLAACWQAFARRGESMPDLRVRVMRSRWGSLSAAGRITLNAHLRHASPECLDYVIFHELCHLRVRGHGRRFYAELAQYVPEWKQRRKELRSLGL